MPSTILTRFLLTRFLATRLLATAVAAGAVFGLAAPSGQLRRYRRCHGLFLQSGAGRAR